MNRITIQTHDLRKLKTMIQAILCCGSSHLYFIIQIKYGRAKYLLSWKVVIREKLNL